MLIQFSVTNYKSFKEKATLSLLASDSDKKTHEDTHIVKIEAFKLRLLKSMVVYGANGSGKSKFFDALQFFKSLIIASSKKLKSEAIEVDPFRLSTVTAQNPSEFEATFLYQGVLYVYGFSANSKEIISEWLSIKEKTKFVDIFTRDNQKFDIHPKLFPKGKNVVANGLVRENALLLSVAAQFNDSLAQQVIDGMERVQMVSGTNEENYKPFSLNRLKEPNFKQRVIGLLNHADFGINDIGTDKLDLENLPDEMPQHLAELLMEALKDGHDFLSDLHTFRTQYDAELKVTGQIKFELYQDESSGTNKYFAMLGPLLDALDNGLILFIDEFDAKLHPNLVEAIVRLFHSPTSNPHNAQLVFNTHNSNLLNADLYRRDQIWFTEKDRYGAATLYSLADFKTDKVRNNEAYEQNYLRGKYGAVPNLNKLEPNHISQLLYANEE